MAVKAKPKRAKKPKQGFLADMEPPSIPEIDDAAETYYETTLEKKAIGERAATEKATLIILMKQEKLDRYVLPDGKVVEVAAASSVKVMKPKKAKEDGDGDED